MSTGYHFDDNDWNSPERAGPAHAAPAHRPILRIFLLGFAVGIGAGFLLTVLYFVLR